MILDEFLQTAINKYLVKRKIQKLCNKFCLPSVNIKYEHLSKQDAVAEPHTNTIVFNIDLITGSEVYKIYNFQTRRLILQSLVIHEIEHLVQYQNSYNTSVTPVSLGILHKIAKTNTVYSFNKMSLYIKGHNNSFLKAIYILQPNEYAAFQKSIDYLKKDLQENNIHQNEIKNRLCAVDNAISFIKQYFDVEDPVQEISNALMNLYDDGNRPCDEMLQDLVVRCAICSYEDEEDFGVDKVSLLLGENYAQSLENNRVLHQKNCNMER